MRIAVDIGFGFVKVQNEEGTKLNFPSVLVRRPESSLSGIIGAKEDDYSITYWEDNNTNAKRLFVGDSAMTNGGNRKWEDKNKFNIEELKVFIATAVGLVNPNNEEVDLIVGLPMSHYLEKKEELIGVLETFDSKITYAKVKDTRKIKFKSVLCFPQGAGAYYAAILNPDGTTKNYELATSSVGIIDIGYRTVDFLVMSKGRKGIVLSEGLSGSLEEDGMNKAFQSIERTMSEKLGRDIGLIEIEKAILWFGSKLEFKGKEHHINKVEENAYSDLAETIASKIKLKWGVDADMLSSVLVSGGGGEALYPALKDKFEQADLQKDSTYANCEGYLGIQAKKMGKE